jgi:anti-sigma factor NepR-like protein
MGDKTTRGRSKAGAKAAPVDDAAPPATGGVEDAIARQLKAMYDEALAQPIPERLLKLLSRLDGDSEAS